MASCVIGFITLWATSIFVHDNLYVTQSWKTYFDSRPLAERSAQSVHSHTYRLEFCGLVLARDENTDGRDIRGSIAQLNDLCDLVKVLASLVSGLLVGYSVNVFLRLTFQSRPSEAG